MSDLSPLSRLAPPVAGSFAAFLLWAAPGLLAAQKAASPEDTAMTQFERIVSPILEKNCYECHGDGAKKGDLAFDKLTTKEQILHNPQLWLKVLRNTRSHVMPPPGEPAPTSAEQLA